MNSSTQIGNIPELKLLETGKQFKIYQVTGKKGMRMPQHISTREAVLIVQEGCARLEIDDKIYDLYQGSVFVIPGCIVHSLIVQQEFKSLVIMDLNSSIEFTN